MSHKRVYSQKKVQYAERLIGLLQDFKNILIVHCNNVGSNQFQQIRMTVRGKGEILMGKNTAIRRVIREASEHDERLWNLLPFIVGNIGLVFTNGNIKELSTLIAEFKVPAAARPGIIAQNDVFIPPGPTGMDPGQTGFFQALGIATKIVRGSVEIISTVHLIKKGDKVGTSETALLSKLNIKPFTYGLVVTHIYDDGAIYDPEILDMTADVLLSKFFKGVSRVASISLAIGYPTLASLPHSMANAFKKLLAVAVTTEYNFKEAEKVKQYLENPDAFVVAAPAGGAAAAGGGAAPAAAEPAADEESASSEGLGNALFGGGDSDSEEDLFSEPCI